MNDIITSSLMSIKNKEDMTNLVSCCLEWGINIVNEVIELNKKLVNEQIECFLLSQYGKDMILSIFSEELKNIRKNDYNIQFLNMSYLFSIISIFYGLFNKNTDVMIIGGFVLFGAMIHNLDSYRRKQ